MKHLNYITETHEGTYEFIPNWNAVAISTKYNEIKRYENATFEISPQKAFMFEDEDTRELFIKNFHKIKHRYDEILPDGTVYYVVHDLTSLKASPEVNYADRLVSRSY